MAIYQDFDHDLHSELVGSLSAADWLCVDTNLPPSACATMLSKTNARKVGLTVSAAKAPRLRNFAQNLDLVFTNRTEACALCELSAGSALDTLVSALQEMGLSSVVITDGGAEVVVMENGTVHQLPVGNIPHVVDVTGAGDALVAGALLGLTKGKSLTKAVAFGIKAARATIQYKGAVRPDLRRILSIS